MSKSKKNTIDPENMIEKYGADAVRWFILSDSPPEKDIQWSDAGVVASNKFLQKVWNMSLQIINRENLKSDHSINKKLTKEIENLSSKIDNSIEAFKFNVTIALFYEAYSIFNRYLNLDVSNKTLCDNFTKIIKLQIPFVPHIANEILDQLNCTTKNLWPSINRNFLDEIKFAVQVNGKTRDIITIKKELNQKQIEKIITADSKAKSLYKIRKLKK